LSIRAGIIIQKMAFEYSVSAGMVLEENYKGSPTSSQNDMNFGPQTA